VRVLLLGGTGFFAPFLVDELVGRGHEAAVLTKSDHDFGMGSVIFGEAEDRRGLSEAIASWSPEAVVDMLHQSGDRARLVLEACTGRVGRSLHLSSAAVYGSNPTCPIDEETELVRAGGAPAGVGALVEADRVVLEAIAQGTPATVVRLPELYGPYDPRAGEWFFAKRALDGRARIAVPDGGLAICHRGFVQNMAWGVMQALTTKRAVGETYNLGEEKLYTLGQFARGVANAFDHAWDIYSVPGGRWRTPYDHTSFYDLRKARGHLRYRDRMIPRDGLELTLGWLSQEPRGESWSWPGIDRPFDYEREDALIEEQGRLLEV
jgi:nucleoside-diphosphate-sugar epimerase